MKGVFKSTLVLFSTAMILLSSCDKIDDLPFNRGAIDFTATAASTNIAPAITDSNNLALQLSWTNPMFAIDSAMVKYVIEIDSAGRNFADPLSKEVYGKKDTGFLAKEINNFAVKRQWEFGKACQMEARVIASYPNNNDRKVSNVVPFTYTPYLVPPEVAPPASRELYIVGSATVGGWINPVPIVQKFTMIDTVTYEGTFYLKGGGEFLLLPVNGNWDHKYNVEDATIPGLANGGDFGADIQGPNIPGPDESGMYRITVDFQHGKFRVVKGDPFGFLYVPGDYQGWSPAGAPTLGSPADDQKFSGFIEVPVGGSYEFKFTTGPSWDNALGDEGPGKLGPGGGNLKFPGAGYYFLRANTEENSWSLTPVTRVGVIGSFAGSGWASDVPMTYIPNEKRWKATITTQEGDQFKFRMNDNWDLNYGDNGQGILEEGGANIGDAEKNRVVSAGIHTIYLYINTGGYYTYSIE